MEIDVRNDRDLEAADRDRRCRGSQQVGWCRALVAPAERAVHSMLGHEHSTATYSSCTKELPLALPAQVLRTTASGRRLPVGAWTLALSCALAWVPTSWPARNATTTPTLQIAPSVICISLSLQRKSHHRNGEACVQLNRSILCRNQRCNISWRLFIIRSNSAFATRTYCPVRSQGWDTDLMYCTSTIYILSVNPEAPEARASGASGLTVKVWLHVV